MAKDARTRELAAIHAAKRDLLLDDDAYRAMLWSVARVRSAADLDAGGRRRVLDHLKAVGWKRKPRRRVAQHPGTPHNLNHEGLLQKVQAQLADMGLPWSYADAIARQQCGIERVAWLRKADQLRAVVAALHVEQEKRGLLAQMDTELQRLGKTREDIAARYKLRHGWERNRRVLRPLVQWLSEEQP
ncbi:MAG: regulatory protein GemA [Aquisalimonadaceae bacterium]